MISQLTALEQSRGRTGQGQAPRQRLGDGGSLLSAGLEEKWGHLAPCSQTTERKGGSRGCDHTAWGAAGVGITASRSNTHWYHPPLALHSPAMQSRFSFVFFFFLSYGKKLGQFAVYLPYGEPDGWRGGSWVNRLPDTLISQARRAAAGNTSRTGMSLPGGHSAGHHGAPGQARVAPAVPPETRALAKEPPQINYSFHGNKRRISNKSSSLQTQEPSKSPGAASGGCVHMGMAAQGTGHPHHEAPTLHVLWSWLVYVQEGTHHDTCP